MAFQPDKKNFIETLPSCRRRIRPWMKRRHSANTQPPPHQDIKWQTHCGHHRNN